MALGTVIALDLALAVFVRLMASHRKGRFEPRRSAVSVVLMLLLLSKGGKTIQIFDWSDYMSAVEAVKASMTLA